MVMAIILCFTLLGGILLLAVVTSQPQALENVFTEATVNSMLFERNKSASHKVFKRTFKRYTYYSHFNVSVLKDYGEKKQPKLRWMHIPKTGTTFGATVLHYCCTQLDDKFVDVIAPFSTVIPSHSVGKLCGECFRAQPRSLNGDPWAHIPFRTGLDSHISIAIFRNPVSRLASQLIYMLVLGKPMSRSFGFRYVEADVLVPLLLGTKPNMGPDLLDKIKLLAINGTTKKTLMLVNDYMYAKHRLKVVDFKNSPFVNRVKECIAMVDSGDNETTAGQRLFGSGSGKTGALTAGGEALTDNSLRDTSASTKPSRSTVTVALKHCAWQAAVQFPGLEGCQTKMLLGRSCYDPFLLTAADLDEAKRRLREEFLFVGKYD